jgi:glycosyltransferase involved in cell wall biosynthesis
METDIVLSVIVPTHNRADALDLTLSGLAKQSFELPWEVIVVNNNSSDNTEEIVELHQKSFPVRLRLLHETNPGPAAARNKGAFAAEGKYLIFIDNDIIVQENFLKNFYVDLQKYEGNWIVGSVKQLARFDKTPFGRFRSGLEDQSRNEVHEIDIITGQGTAMLRSQFLELKGFDEGFHFASGEDRELAIRAKSKGIRIFCDPNIISLHNDWAGTTIKDYCKRQKTYTITEPFFWLKYGKDTPRLKLVKENLPPALKRDGIRLFSWKITKRMLGSNLGNKILITMCNVAEKIMPN